MLTLGVFFTSGSCLKLVEIVPKLELGPGVTKKKKKKTKKPLGKEAEDIWLEKQYGKK